MLWLVLLVLCQDHACVVQGNDLCVEHIYVLRILCMCYIRCTLFRTTSQPCRLANVTDNIDVMMLRSNACLILQQQCSVATVDTAR